ncbi:unnamed protein product, partial [Closterium sp. NIES-54]
MRQSSDQCSAVQCVAARTSPHDDFRCEERKCRGQRPQTSHAQRTTHEAAGPTGSHRNAAAAGAAYHQILHAVRLLLALATTKSSTLCGSTSTSKTATATATSTTAAAASTTSAAASTTSTAATEAPTPSTTPTSTATPSASYTASATAPAIPSTTLTPFALAFAAPPTGADAAPTSSVLTRLTAEAEATEGRRDTREHPSKKG